MKPIIGLSIIFMLAGPLASAPALAGARDMGCSPTLANPCTGDSPGGGSGSHSSNSELGKAIGEALGQAIGEAMRGNPEAEARRKAEAEAERRRVEEAIRQRDEERKNRLLGGMIGVDDSAPLGLMGVESGPELSLMTGDQAVPTPAGRPPAQQSVAEKQVQALSCAISELQEPANGMGEEGAQLRAELKGFLAKLRMELSQPCSGQPETHNVQTLNLSILTKGAKKQEDHLEGSLLVTRDEQSCEVHLDVQHASSRPGASSPAAGQAGNEGQSLIHMDKRGNILAAETPADVAACLARLAR